MANFIKCKQESVTYKKYEYVKVKDEIKRKFFFFLEVIPVFEEAFCKEETKVTNNPINIEYVKNISRIGGIYCGYYKYSLHYGIKFNLVGGGESYWYYDDENVRDEQFEEISNNNHLYKSKVSI